MILITPRTLRKNMLSEKDTFIMPIECIIFFNKVKFSSIKIKISRARKILNIKQREEDIVRLRDPYKNLYNKIQIYNIS